MGAPMAFSPGGLPIYKKSNFAAACKKDRNDPEPEPPVPDSGQRWRWLVYDYSIVGYNTEVSVLSPSYRSWHGDVLLRKRPFPQYEYTYEDFDTLEDQSAYSAEYTYKRTSLFIRYNEDNFPFHFLQNSTGEGVVGASVILEDSEGYPYVPQTMVRIWDFQASTLGKEFILLPLHGSYSNGMHPCAFSGWIAFWRKRYT